MTDKPQWLHAELRKYAKESDATLSDSEKDRAIVATVARYVEQEFGYMMGKECWAEYTGRRSKHYGIAR